MQTTPHWKILLAVFAVGFPQQTEFSNIYPLKANDCAMLSVWFLADIADKQKFQVPIFTLNTIGSVWMDVGHAMTQATLCRSLNEDARIRSHVTPSGIFVGQRGHWEKFLSKYFGFPLSAWFHQWSTLIHLHQRYINSTTHSVVE
jgi:hypothetical protein